MLSKSRKTSILEKLAASNPMQQIQNSSPIRQMSAARKASVKPATPKLNIPTSEQARKGFKAAASAAKTPGVGGSSVVVGGKVSPGEAGKWWEN